MSSPPKATARFFAPNVALVSVLVLLAGLGVGAYCIHLVINEGRISIGGFLLSAALLVAGPGVFVTSAFPKGCRTCKKAFVEAGTTFPPQFYDHVAGLIRQGDPQAIYQLVGAPMGGAPQWTGLAVSHCPVCKRVGEATVTENRTKADYNEFVRGTPALPLSEQALAASLAMVERRPRPQS